MGRKCFCIFPANLWKNQSEPQGTAPGRADRAAPKQAPEQPPSPQLLRTSSRSCGPVSGPNRSSAARRGPRPCPRPRAVQSPPHQQREPQRRPPRAPNSPQRFGLKGLKSAFRKYIQEPGYQRSARPARKHHGLSATALMWRSSEFIHRVFNDTNLTYRFYTLNIQLLE